MARPPTPAPTMATSNNALACTLLPDCIANSASVDILDWIRDRHEEYRLRRSEANLFIPSIDHFTLSFIGHLVDSTEGIAQEHFEMSGRRQRGCESRPEFIEPKGPARVLSHDDNGSCVI